MDILKIIVDKLSQYNFLTNIIPGSVLCIILKYVAEVDLIPKEAYSAGIVFYFAGLVNGKVGSLVVEKLLKKWKIVVFAPYNDFIDAEKKDNKLTILSQENNTYRAYISVSLISLVSFLILLFLGKYKILSCPDIIERVALLVSLLALFLFSYIKQTNYVRKRVEKNVKTAR